MLHLLCFTFIIGLSVAAQFECPDKNGFYADPVQCDKYYECYDNKPTTKLCPDGLVFDENLKRYGKCDQPFNADCGNRTELQPPSGTDEYCPRKNGLFTHLDETICDTFYTCEDGVYTETKCVAGLHFEPITGQCLWPDAAGRVGCEEHRETLPDGFKCPKEFAKFDKVGQAIVHPQYPHPEDCQKFYVCINGKEPRLSSCIESRDVFDPETGRCSDPAIVAGCEDWFDAEETKPAKPKGKP